MVRLAVCNLRGNLKTKLDRIVLSCGQALSWLLRVWEEKLPLRTKLLLSFVLLTAALTCGTLLVVRHDAMAQEQQRIEKDTSNAILTFQVVHQQVQQALSHKADLLAWMAFSRDADGDATQDASDNPLQADECDLLMVTDPRGMIRTMRTKGWSFPQDEAQKMVWRSVYRNEKTSWWYGGGRLYQVVLAPFYEDAATRRLLSGYVAVGRSIDQRAVRDLAQIASSDLAFSYGDQIAISTLNPVRELDLARQRKREGAIDDLKLDGEHYHAKTIELNPGAWPHTNLIVFKSYRGMEGYLRRLNRLLAGLWLTALLLGATLIYFISDSVTRTLGQLVFGVRALEQGDYRLPLAVRGDNEVSRLTKAFINMRETLRKNDEQREHLEGQLRQSQKMEALGRLAGGVAHDFNNLLTVIRGHSELLQDETQEGDPLHKHAQQIRRTADRAASLTRQLLAFSRTQVLETKVVDVNDVIRDMSKLLQRLVREDIDFNLSLSESPARVKADTAQLEQVLLNLTVNASDAMEGAGKLTIAAENVIVGEEEAHSIGSVNPGKYARITVTDSGHGMDAATKARIFEPFFTTKERGKGTGLGLATVYGVVKQTGGFILVTSEVGKGSKFELYLPNTELPAETRAREVGSPNLGKPIQRKTVLVVEDERDVRELACEFLASAGYNVLTAEDGMEAIETVARLGPCIEAVLTDMVMPKLGGTELGAKLEGLLPDVKVLYMSGYLEPRESARLIDAGCFLQKPFSRDTLLEKLGRILRKHTSDSTRTRERERQPTVV